MNATQGGGLTVPSLPTGARFLAWLPAFIHRDWKIARSYRLQFVLDFAGIPLSLGLFLFLGRLVDRSGALRHPDLQQGYFAFAAVGLAVISMLNIALTSFSAKLRTDQTSGTFEVLLASVSPSVVVVGSAAFDILKAMATLVVTLIIAALFGLRFQLGTGSAVALAVGFPALIMTFAALGIVVAACATVFKQITALLGLITSGLTLLSGVYFPVSYLPQPLRTVAEFLPFTWGVNVLRTAVLDGEVATRHLGLLTGFAVASLPASLFLFRRAVDYARRQGTLTHF